MDIIREAALASALGQLAKLLHDLPLQPTTVEQSIVRNDIDETMSWIIEHFSKETLMIFMKEVEK